MKGLIISSGTIRDYKLLKELSSNSEYIICADGGLRYAISSGILPDAIIGDLDSVDEKCKEFIDNNIIPIIKFPVEKDETDTELAVLHLIELGCDDITLSGVTGSRLDHTFGNIYLLKMIKNKGIQGKIVDDNNTIYLVDDYIKLERRDGYYTSVIPITQEGVIVTLTGFYYPLNEELINFGSTLGISNKIITDYGEIKIVKGNALIIEARD